MKAVIFDWSGVVKDCVLAQLWIVNRIFTKFGAAPISLEELRENWEQPWTLFYKKYLPNVSVEAEQAAYREAIFNVDCPKSESFPGIAELIKRLKGEGYFIAVLSSDLPETLFSEIKEYDLENIFDEIITSVDVKLEAVQDLITKNNLDLKNTVFIGDSNHEIDVAKKLGIKSIAVTWGFCNEKRLKSSNPDYLIASSDELEDILK